MNTIKKIAGGLKFSRFLIFHPFKGFWDLKHEKEGSMSAAMTILGLVVITFIIRSQFTGFILNYSIPSEFNIFFQITGIVLPFFLWCVSNWCITTLMDGEGFLKDIIITMAFAMVPLILINIPMVILSNVITIEESSFYVILDSVAIIWSVFLVLCGLMTVHQFTMSKTIFTVLVALLCMLIIVFILILYMTLIQDVINFIKLLFNEMQLRINY